MTRSFWELLIIFGQLLTYILVTAFRDRNAGSDRNRGKPAEEAAGRGAPRGGSRWAWNPCLTCNKVDSLTLVRRHL